MLPVVAGGSSVGVMLGVAPTLVGEVITVGVAVAEQLSGQTCPGQAILTCLFRFRHWYIFQIVQILQINSPVSTGSLSPGADGLLRVEQWLGHRLLHRDVAVAHLVRSEEV